MSFSQARTDLGTVLAAIQAAWFAAKGYALVIETENRNNVDYDGQTKPFLSVELQYFGGAQLDMADAPIKAQYGVLIVAVVSKEGKGTADAEAVKDFVIPYLERKNFTALRTEVAEPQRAVALNGWYYQPVSFNCKFYRV